MRIFLVSLCAVLLVLYILHSIYPKPITLTRDQDILSSPNLINYINLLRAQKNLPAFVEDSVLMQKTRKESEDLKGDVFSTFNTDHYSVKAFVTGWNRKNEIYVGTRIGVWVTYYARKQGERPTAYVAILIR